MKKVLTGALTALTLFGATAAEVTSASAQPRQEWRGGGVQFRGGGFRGGEWRGDRGGDALFAGLLGLGIGAALASPHYDYGPPAYYAGPAYYGWYRGCRAEWRWNPYWGRYERLRVCY
jgi:hypothetical protein